LEEVSPSGALSDFDIGMIAALWVSNAGFVIYEIFEFLEDPKGYFSLKGLGNMTDVSFFF
jgi:hypothetical protein